MRKIDGYNAEGRSDFRARRFASLIIFSYQSIDGTSFVFFKLYILLSVHEKFVYFCNVSFSFDWEKLFVTMANAKKGEQREDEREREREQRRGTSNAKID